MNKYLWKFYWDCGRSGSLSGLFVATENEIKEAIGREVYFGEVLGKHSEVYGQLEEGDITRVNLDSETVEKVEKVLGETWSGWNPLHYVKYQCIRCKEEDFNHDELWDINEVKVCWECMTEEEKKDR